MKRLLFLCLMTLILTSCASIMATYLVGLSQVESPINAKQQFGETKVVSFNEEGVNKYRYEDDYINIIWYVGLKEFNFTLKNKSEHTIKINWDDISYVDINGQVGRVMHSGVKYIDKNSSQPSITIPKGASIRDILLPTDNVYYYEGWREKSLIPSFYQTVEDMRSEAGKYIGKKMSILFPIVIEGVQNDYTFIFNIDKWTNK